MRWMAMAILFAMACGGAAERQETQPIDLASGPTVRWTFTSFTDVEHLHPDVQGTFDIVKVPFDGCRRIDQDGGVFPCDDIVTLSGNATVGTFSGTATGTEVPSNGIFRVVLDVGSGATSSRYQIDGTENGSSFAGYISVPGKNEEIVGNVSP